MLANNVADVSIRNALIQLRNPIIFVFIFLRRITMPTNNALKLACIGGGTGLSSLLSGLKQYTRAKHDNSEIIDMDNLAAIVSVSDDGGSSGRLIQEFDVLPPGDIRKLLFTLSDTDELLSNLFEYRFSSTGDLGGHTVGNLLLTALTDLKGGNFPQAIEAASRLLAVRGRIIPVSLDYTVLCAKLDDDEIVRGESYIPDRTNRAPIQRVFFEPRENGKNQHHPQVPYECVAHDEASEAIKNSDVIIIGPGSLYTSIMPNLVVKGIADAINASNAMKIYVCNVMTQPGETDGYSVTDHVNAMLNHADISLDYIIANNKIAPEEVIEQYVQRALSEQFARIKSLTAEGLSMLDENAEQPVDVASVLEVTKQISQLSDKTEQVADASKVQVFYDREQEHLEKQNIEVIEADLIVVRDIGEAGTPWNVIRHEPEQLARTLIKVLGNHPQLHEPV
jgi:uncharacterized cofD-like protein